MARKKQNHQRDVATENFMAGLQMLTVHPVFTRLRNHAMVYRSEHYPMPADGWAYVTSNGEIFTHPHRRAAPEEWMHVFAHCLLHLGFGHFRERENAAAWQAACDCYVAKFLSDMKLGRAPVEMQGRIEAGRDEEALYRRFCEQGMPTGAAHLGCLGQTRPDMVFMALPVHQQKPTDWSRLLGEGLADAVSDAVKVAAGVLPYLGAVSELRTPANRAREWFIASYPLLGALVAAFTIIEDPLLCHRLEISVAAVDIAGREIIINPAAGLDEMECRFVMAHEILHAALRHDARRQGRDAYLWNIACDYAINGWLIEMGVGEMPRLGCLYDAELKGLSSEAIYDRIATDLRRYRKLCTLRGVGAGDMIERGAPHVWSSADGVTLDEWYRRALAQGLEFHQNNARGFLPADLVEEIRALAVPPVPWDVELAHWFDHHFPPQDKVRSYARASRRQMATPDIARPALVRDSQLPARTFGVVLDTSGSMDRRLLGQALGAIASYSQAREVPAARVVFCDAQAYDAGYMAPESIAERVQVRGRGGTILQPGIDLLQNANDFPPDGPLLIITDGFCDRLRVRREHAFLLPVGHSLPFVPRGPVFRLK
jgi:predicted metal-dependent peptidase